MPTSFNKDDIFQGEQIKRQAREQSSTFGTESASNVIRNDVPLDRANSRKAGQRGEFAIQLMDDPDARAANDEWMDRLFSGPGAMQWDPMAGEPPAEEPLV